MVWLAFLAAMTTAAGFLALAHGSLRSARGAPMLAAMGSTSAGETGPSIEFARSDSASPRRGVPLDHDRWTGIIIHHSGSPAGDPESLNRQHTAWGLDELGYHFVIGNGKGMGDGAIHASARWLAQRPGAHAIGPEGQHHNQHSIAICLIGNGEARPFTARQMRSLILLVRGLQREFLIGADRVLLHRDIAEVRSPGGFFAEADFRAPLLRHPR